MGPVFSGREMSELRVVNCSFTCVAVEETLTSCKLDIFEAINSDSVSFFCWCYVLCTEFKVDVVRGLNSKIFYSGPVKVIDAILA